MRQGFGRGTMVLTLITSHNLCFSILRPPGLIAGRLSLLSGRADVFAYHDECATSFQIGQ